MIRTVEKLVIKYLAVLATLILACIPSSAQERIRVFNDVKSERTIIRDIDGEKRLIYNEGDVNPYFILLNDSDGACPAMSLPTNMAVLDFTIYERMVYFCGYSIEGTDTLAVVGWFGLDGFPFSEVRYAEHSYYRTFTNIDTYKVHANEPEIHFVLVGRNHGQNYNVLDAREIRYGRLLFYQAGLAIDLTQQIVDDLIVTDNYVVVSSRTKDFTFREGILWCFSKPNTPESNIFSVDVQRCSLGSVRGEILLESFGRTNKYVNDYVALYQGDRIERGIRYLTRFNGPYHLSCHHFGSEDHLYTFRDAKYNPDSRALEIHVGIKQKILSPFSYNDYYHVDVSSINRVGYIDGHRVENDAVHSLAYLLGKNRYEVTGHLNHDVDRLRIYSYEYNHWDSCLPRAESILSLLDKSLYYYPQASLSDYFYFYHQQLATEEKYFTVTTVCE